MLLASLKAIASVRLLLSFLSPGRIHENIHESGPVGEYISKLQKVSESALSGMERSETRVFIDVGARSDTFWIRGGTAWEAGVLPLNYSRSTPLDYHSAVSKTTFRHAAEIQTPSRNEAGKQAGGSLRG
jgi:hypothetical protein